MHKSSTLTVARVSPAVLKAALVCLFAVLVAVGGHVRVPIPGNPVPLTLQVVFVLMAGAFLTPAAAAASMVVFIAAGLAGAPVYSGGGAGPAYLLGPTGGYLMAFPIAAALCSLLTGGLRNSFLRTGLAMTAAVAAIHVVGMLHLGAYLGGDFRGAFSLGVAPFIMGDLVKVCVAASVTTAAQGIIGSRGEHP